MAGRGTDIRLGGHDESDKERVAELGGLYVIGTGRHESSRVDDQLRGRAGRQGDPGGSVFFVSMQDELLTSYAPDAAPPREVADDGLVSDAAAHREVAHAQRVAEGGNQEIHRNTWRYSKLVDDQRGIVLTHRTRMLTTDSAIEALAARCPDRYAELTDTVDEDVLVTVGRRIVLYHLDRAWADHLAALAEIREGIHLRALGQGPNPFGMSLDPLTEFHAEAVKLFTRLFEQVEEASAETFQNATITAEGIDADAADLKRPSATWTYLVQDNPSERHDHRRGHRRRRRRPETAQRDLDLPGPGQPLRHRLRPRPPPASPRQTGLTRSDRGRRAAGVGAARIGARRPVAMVLRTE
jgi:preprotein translocase subunit SecA